jgi:DNA processing protein
MRMASLSLARPVSPWLEMGAYEALWDEAGTWFKSLAEKFSAYPGALPSDFVPDSEYAYKYSQLTVDLLRKGGIRRFGVRIHGAGDYPLKLRAAEHPVEMLYYQGWWELVDARCVAIVGTRKPSRVGVQNATKLATSLARDGFTKSPIRLR